MHRVMGVLLLLAFVLGLSALVFPSLAPVADDATSDPPVVYLPIVARPQPSPTPRPDQIAFTLSDGVSSKLYLMHADGTHISRLTGGESEAELPVWSPSGDALAYIGVYASWRAVFIALPYTPPSSEVRRPDYGPELVFGPGLVYEPGLTQGPVTWSPDGKKIAFGLDSNIFTINVDGTDKTLITYLPGMEADYLAWSPDGQKIAFASAVETRPQIFTVNLDGSGLVQLTREIEGCRDGPKWSPDGTYLIYVATIYQAGTMRFDVIRIRQDGSDRTNLTTWLTRDDPLAYSPTWSPDGSLIAFATKRVYLMRADGTRPNSIAEAAYQANPDWSPDGTRLAFRGKPCCGIVDVDKISVYQYGHAVQRLVPGYEPKWRPRGP